MEGRREGESNICCRVLLDMVGAKTHKVGYYLCKSMRVPEPQGKQPALHRAQNRTTVLLQDHLDAGAEGDNICSVFSGAANSN